MSNKMTAVKRAHRTKLVEYIGDWNNDFPRRADMPGICGFTSTTLYLHFTPAELQEIEEEGFELRKRQAVLPRADMYNALYQEGLKGNVPAIKEYLDRIEGKTVDKLKLSGSSDKPIQVVTSTLLDRLKLLKKDDD